MLNLDAGGAVTVQYLRLHHPEWMWTVHRDGFQSQHYVGVRGMTAVRVERRAEMFDGDGERPGRWWVQSVCYRGSGPLGPAQLFSSWGGRPPELHLFEPGEEDSPVFRCYSCGYMRGFDCGADDDPKCDHCWSGAEIPVGVTYGAAVKAGWTAVAR
jgi:hypothetical protein